MFRHHASAIIRIYDNMNSYQEIIYLMKTDAFGAVTPCFVVRGT
jgi:hypothetical protein